MRTGLGAALTLAACGQPPVLEPGPVQPAGPAVTTAPQRDSPRPTGSGGIDEARAKDEAARILDAVAQARNLEVTSDVDVRVIDKPNIRAYAKELLYEHTTPEEFALHGRIAQTLGVIAPGASLEQIHLDVLEEGVLGFYDPKKKALFIGDYVSSSLLSQTVGHEIVHALQDMHFGLEDRMEPTRHFTDLDEAERFLIEGEAQAAYFAWVSGTDGLVAIDDAVLEAGINQSLEMISVMSQSPVIARGLHLPYTAGTATVVRMVVQDGWQSIDALHEDPPTTTEQMLHVDKLRAREPAREVAFDHEKAAAAFGKPVVWHDQFGEAQWLALLADVESAAIARRCAAGWGGDAMIALETDEGDMSVAIAVVMDDRREAQELEASLAKYADERIEGTTVLDRKRDTVMFVSGVADGIDRKVLRGALWDALTVDGPPSTPKTLTEGPA